MGLRDWFSRRKALHLAIERGLKPGGDLEKEIRGLGEYQVQSKTDARSICELLDTLAASQTAIGGDSALHAVVRLFESVPGSDSPAFAVLASEGIPRLAAIVEPGIENTERWKTDDVFFALKILAMYGTSEGTEIVLRAARKRFKPDNYWWTVILGRYTKQHPKSERLFRALGDSLLPDSLAGALLVAANSALIAGGDCPHPFDSDAGKQRLESWLTDPDSSYPVSAAVALPFISSPGRDRLLALALDHTSPDTQLEAAWAAGKLGHEAGIKLLARYCLDVGVSDKAKRYLAELNRDDAIPVEANDPDFQACAEFARWIAHPNELGRVPDEVKILDKRELDWPPEGIRKPFWLIQYHVRDTTGLEDDQIGVGLVGSITFCFFSYRLEERPPEDCYAIHCCWEMEHQGLIREAEVDEGSTEYDQMLSQWKDVRPKSVRITRVAELSLELKYPQRLVGIARAETESGNGWLVLDGPRSRWYADSELPETQFETTVLKLHIGRVLLGFTTQPDRGRFLRTEVTGRPPQDIIRTYEDLLERTRQSAREAKKYLGQSDPLGSAFPRYVAALKAVKGWTSAFATAAAYESLLEAAKTTDASLHKEVFDNWTPLGKNLEAYADALVILNRHAELSTLVEHLRPYWDHNLGYKTLGMIAYKGKDDRLAESFFLKLRHSDEEWYRFEEMGLLAEIWQRQGQVDAARELLLDALRGTLKQSQAATVDTRKLCEEWFQNHRASFLRLFPDEGENALLQSGIPSSTLSIKR